jgi:hypothetical protein
MKTVWKFDVPFHHVINIWMPEGARVLTVQYQEGIPRIWVEVDTTKPTTSRGFLWFGTGHPLEDGAQYIGTLQEGALVWHLYEVAL